MSRHITSFHRLSCALVSSPCSVVCTSPQSFVSGLCSESGSNAGLRSVGPAVVPENVTKAMTGFYTLQSSALNKATSRLWNSHHGSYTYSFKDATLIFKDSTTKVTMKVLKYLNEKGS